MYAKVTHWLFARLYVRLCGLSEALHKDQELAQETVNESVEVSHMLADYLPHLVGPMMGGGH